MASADLQFKRTLLVREVHSDGTFTGKAEVMVANKITKDEILVIKMH